MNGNRRRSFVSGLAGGLPIGQEDLTEARTALFVLSRQAGEGRDRRYAPGDFLLTEEEKA